MGGSLGDDLDDEGILEPRSLKVGSAVVEDEVDTCELLQTLEHASSQETFADVAAEAIQVGGFGEAHFVRMVGADFAQLFHERWVVYLEATQLRERSCCLDWVSVLPLEVIVVVTGSLTSSYLSCLIKKRGVSGRRNRPTQIMIDQANCTAIGMR
jgi:hypothetical protein